jgi:O-glycosyl hydrolase
MTNRKIIAAVMSVAIASVLLWMGCSMAVNEGVERSVPIFTPYISVQPISYAFKVSDYDAPPRLEVKVAEWDSGEGRLSYQWYTFETLKEFYENAATAIDGAKSSTYTPANITATAGKIYYYYVVVTNTNSNAIGEKSASLKSDVAAISFYADNNPPIPVITKNPVSASYIIGRTAAIAPLDVRATVEEGGSIRYQWYSFRLTDGFNTDGTPKGTLIPNEILRTYLPDKTDLIRGDNYYYVVVANVRFNAGGDETGRAEQVSMPAIITMMPGEKAAPPRITRQPRDIQYFPADSLNTLTVVAESVDSGALSYQWYESATLSGAGTAISDEEDATVGKTASFQPPKEAKFYYVIVTNTNTEVTGATTATIQSKTVEVKVKAAGSGSANAFITVNPNKKFQYIRGYGGMETTWGNFFQSDEEDMENMFSTAPNKLGYNMWRIMIPPITTNIDGDEEGRGGLKEYVMARQYSNRYYRNVQYVNAHNGYVLASPWSPPKEWKTNHSIVSGGHLDPRYYKEFANYLRSYARHMLNEGAPIYAVSIANEPNYAGGYDGCEWTPEQMRDFYKQVGRFTQGVRGMGGGKVIPTVLTVNGESANTPDINYAAMNDPVSNAAIDLFARHVYGEQRVVLWGHPNLNGREVWMTEHNINSASATAFPQDSTWNFLWRFMNDVDLVIRLNNENAFVWWVVKRFYSFIGEGDAATTEHAILPRGWGLAHYSKFTIDTTRIDVNVTGSLSGGGAIVMGGALDEQGKPQSGNVNSLNFNLDNSSIKITAFISQDGNEISLVMWAPTSTDGSGGFNLGTAQINMPEGFTIRSASAMRSRSEGGGSRGVANCAQWEVPDIASDRKSAYVSLPSSQLLSVKFIKE